MDYKNLSQPRQKLRQQPLTRPHGGLIEVQSQAAQMELFTILIKKPSETTMEVDRMRYHCQARWIEEAQRLILLIQRTTNRRKKTRKKEVRRLIFRRLIYSVQRTTDRRKKTKKKKKSPSINISPNKKKDESASADEIKNKFVPVNILNANARSLNNKLCSLIDMYQEFELSISILTETWFKDGKKLKEELDKLNYGENIGLVAKNRSTRGGGVAVAFDNTKLVLKEFKFPGNVYEMVCTVGNSSASNRKIAVIAVYIPPKQKSDTTTKMRDAWYPASAYMHRWNLRRAYKAITTLF